MGRYSVLLRGSETERAAPMSALGHKRTFRAVNCDVCFTPESGHRLTTLPCPLSANSGHSNRVLIARIEASSFLCRLLCHERSLDLRQVQGDADEVQWFSGNPVVLETGQFTTV